MANRGSEGFYSSLEKHLVRILLIVLLLIAAYKLVAIEIGFLRCQ
jgi:hypothetical protein